MLPQVQEQVEGLDCKGEVTVSPYGCGEQSWRSGLTARPLYHRHLQKYGQDAKGGTKMTWNKWDRTSKFILASSLFPEFLSLLKTFSLFPWSLGCRLGINLFLLSLNTRNHQNLTFLFSKACCQIRDLEERLLTKTHP